MQRMRIVKVMKESEEIVKHAIFSGAQSKGGARAWCGACVIHGAKMMF